MPKSLFRLVIAAYFGISSLVLPSQAANLGGSGAQFLSLKTSAKSEAMAGAMTALGSDLAAASINPAAPSKMLYPEAYFSQALLFEDIKFSYFSLGQPTKWGVPTFDFMQLTYGDIDTRPREGNLTGSHSPGDFYIGMGWATRGNQFPIKNVDIGANVRYVNSDYILKSANTVSVSLGGIYQTPLEGLNLGASINHLGPSLNYGNAAEPLPTTLRLGLGYKTPEFSALSSSLGLSLDGVFSIREKQHIAASLEFKTLKLMSAIIGYAGDEGLEQRLRYGFGIGMNAIHLDYSAAPLGNVGVAHRFSIRLRFGAGLWNFKEQISKSSSMEEDMRLAQKYFEKGQGYARKGKNPLSPYRRARFYARKVLKQDITHSAANEIFDEIERAQKARQAREIYSEALLTQKEGQLIESLGMLYECMALDPSNETFKTTFETVKKSLKNKQILQEEMNETLRKASAHETQSKAPLKISEAKDNLVLTPSGRSPTQINEPALRTFYESAIKHMSQRNLDEAIRLLTDIYKEDRRYQDVSKKLVICLRGRIIQNYANREYEKAEADLDKVLKIDPSNQRLAEIREMNEAMLTKIYALQSKKNP